MVNSTPGTPTTYGPDSNDLWGNRNLQSTTRQSRRDVQSGRGQPLWASRSSTDDDGGDGLTITAPKNIIRTTRSMGAKQRRSVQNGVEFVGRQ